MSISDVLNATAAHINEHGWTRRCGGWAGMREHAGRFCIEGAMAAVLGLDASGLERLILQEHPAYKAMQDYLGLGEMRLWVWNDATALDEEEVIEALQVAALIAEQVSA
jgi:hypothetical protein